MSSTLINSKEMNSLPRSSRPLQLARKRLIWKELRQNIPLLIVFAVVMILTLVLSKSFVQSQPSSPAYGQAFWLAIIWTFTFIFALAIGVFIFAPEKENHTDQFLSILPINSGFAVRIKLGVGIATIVCFALIGGLCQLVEVTMLGTPFRAIASSQNNFVLWQTQSLAAGTAIVIVSECFVWGAICSLYSKRAIVAALQATGCFILLSWFFPSLCAMTMSGYPSPTPAIVAFLAGKALVYVGMGFAIVHLGGKWLGNTSSRTSSNARQDAMSGVRDPAAFASRATTKVYSSLVWQSFRQYGTGLWVGMAVSVPLFAIGVVSVANIRDGDFGWSFAFVTFLVALAVIPLVGSMFVFLGDHQDRNYRFFQQHAEFGRKLWFARLLPAGLLSMTCAVLIVIAIYVCGLMLQDLDYSRANSIWSNEYNILYRCIVAGILVVFSAFAIGQFSSMFFRSGVFTFVCAVCLCAISLIWIGWLSFVDVNLWLYYAPVPASLLVITWWRAPKWLADRNRIRDLAAPWIALVVVAGCVFGAMAYQRIHGVPENSVSLNQQERILNQRTAISLDNPQVADHKRFDLWKAADAVVGSEKLLETEHSGDNALGLSRYAFTGKSNQEIDIQPLTDFIDANQAAIALLDRAAVNDFGQQFLDPDSRTHRLRQISNLELLMSARARKSELLDGDLNQALEHWIRYAKFQDKFFGTTNMKSAASCLIRWSEFPDQDPELIKQAIESLEFTNSSWRSRANHESLNVQVDFENWYHDLQQGIEDQGFHYYVHFQHPPGIRTPWEMERSRRIAQNTISLIPTRFENFSYYAVNPALSLNGYYGGNYYEAFEKMISAKPFDQLANELFTLDGVGRWQEVYQMFKLIQIRRYAQVRLALNAWKLENNSYPERLIQLVPDYLEQLPVDVFEGGNFTYAPTGKNAKVGWSLRLRRNNHGDEVAQTREFHLRGRAEYSISKEVFPSLIPKNTPFLLPWASYVDKVPLKCEVKDADDPKPFEVYDFSNTLMFEEFHSYILPDPRQQEKLAPIIGFHRLTPFSLPSF